MNDAKHPLAKSPDAQMIAVLRSCGFDVRVQHRAAAEAAPEVYGTIDNAVSLFRLAVAGADCIGNPESKPVQQPAAVASLNVATWNAVDQLDAPVPAAGVQGERERLRAEQAERVMPLIGPLLDAYEGARKDELADLSEGLLSCLSQINQAMVSDNWQPDSWRDAARYRWLRDSPNSGACIRAMYEDGIAVPAAVDEMIDTARAAAPAACENGGAQ